MAIKHWKQEIVLSKTKQECQGLTQEDEEEIKKECEHLKIKYKLKKKKSSMNSLTHKKHSILVSILHKQ